MSGQTRQRLELPDLILALYIAVFVRQYLWRIANNSAAWSFTALFSAAVWWLHWRTKEPADAGTPHLFWFVVAPPLFALFILRAALAAWRNAQIDSDCNRVA